MGCIYVATNRTDGCRYVGKTVTTMKQRREAHEREAKERPLSLFHQALHQYGFDAFIWQIVIESEDDEELLWMEQISIEFLRSKIPNGYNMTDGGEGMTGLQHSSETKAKIGEASRRRRHSLETRAKISKALLGHSGYWEGKELTKAHREKIGISQLGNTHTKGRKHTEEEKRRIAASNRRTKDTEEYKARCRQQGYDRIFSPETRMKISEALRGNKNCLGRIVSEETRRRMSRSRKGKLFSEESKAKLRAAWVRRKARGIAA